MPALREAVCSPIGCGPLLHDGQRHQLADRGAHGRGSRARRRGDRARLHLHGYPRFGSGRRGDPGHRRHRREPRIESGRIARCDRTPNPCRDARAHVGSALRHERDHAYRPGHRRAGDRGRVSGSGRRLRGQDARVDRPHRRIQLQPLQEHELRRRGSGRDQRRRLRRTHRVRDRSLPVLLGRKEGHLRRVHGKRRESVGDRGRDHELPARSDRRDGGRHAGSEGQDHQGDGAVRPVAQSQQQPRWGVRDPCHLPAPVNGGRRCARGSERWLGSAQDGTSRVHGVGSRPAAPWRPPPGAEPIRARAEQGLPHGLFEGDVPAVDRHSRQDGLRRDPSRQHRQ